ncbi:chromosome segregation protein SMC [Agrococcus sp. SCSIO52902]|uniref:chromosome segregation protein SMC n=1 Tax=Agrococcus sp. SCSIO52902 TaxID=2933290 RepID=UPI001FF4AEA7|nr:chromosome segregation protein SMC [Agrococcus sp. SCSIO52902]UOW00765.1 chromosome segregation protein SMC [Agrococcus sp. SCSIO52902]
MHLKTLTVKGFKSFARPTTFQFEPGVTCVVGPNGSGKSNVVDALAWVMGEQGAKTLRGGKMEDVIFAGTATSGPLGRAHVELVIDNADGALPIEYAEVQISRTLFRNGGSEYAINGESCRLLDVQELLSDSGLGREMHVIVGQGQLDNVLQATPADRRGYIEEAAGILKHRRRKEKTLRKLDAMQANLTRLQDLAGEIRRQLKPLGQQAEIAKEAATIQATVRDARARLIADEVLGLRAQLESAARSESERKSERIVLQEQLEQARLRAGRIEESMVGDDVDRARTVAHGLERELSRLQSLHALAGQRLALLEEAPDLGDAAPLVTPDMVQAARDEAAALGDRVADAEGRLGKAAAATALARAELDSLDEEIATQAALVSKHDLEAAGHRSKVEVAQSTLAAREAEVARRETALANARQRLAEATEAAGALGDEQEAGDAESLAGAYRDADEAQAALSAALDERRDALHAVERERDALAARTSALTSALETGNASAGILDAGIAGVTGLVAERVKVRKGFEAAIAAALGTLGEAVLAETRDAAAAAIEHAHDAGLGRIEAVVGDAVPMRPDVPEVEGAVHAPTVVDAPAGVLGVLAFTFVVDTIEAARDAGPRIAALELGAPVTIVTRRGDYVSEYLMRGGSDDAQSRLELLAERDAAIERLDELRAAIEREAGALEDARQAHQQAKRAAAEALETLRAHDAASAARGEQRSRARARLEAATGEHDRAAAALAEARGGIDEARRAVEAAELALERFQDKPRPMLDASARDGLLAELEAARGAETDLRVELETARERVRAELARAAALERDVEAQRARAEEAARRAVLRERQREQASRVLAAIPPVLGVAERSVQEARAVLAEREAARRDRNEELGRLRRDEAVLRERLQELTEHVHVAEMETYEQRLHLSNLLERAGSELGLEEAVLVAEHAPEEGWDRKAEQARLQDAERKLARLGRVNPLALEEFAALEQRHTFLTEQLSDLAKTRKDLEQIIADLDVTMEAIFAAAFEDTKAAFTEVFPILFPGGSGALALTDPDDLLNTGVEVTVRPAGKKIDRISLLSGGERSLAAVALMVAIFKARPSPFYIMDEVEAALDDANLGRLLTVFEQLRESSQLIIITHQKRTMEIADALYGVSMRQDGVSAVVGQRTTREREPVDA